MKIQLERGIPNESKWDSIFPDDLGRHAAADRQDNRVSGAGLARLCVDGRDPTAIAFDGLSASRTGV